MIFYLPLLLMSGVGLAGLAMHRWMEHWFEEEDYEAWRYGDCELADIPLTDEVNHG
jgi:hypothetical protein